MRFKRQAPASHQTVTAHARAQHQAPARALKSLPRRRVTSVESEAQTKRLLSLPNQCPVTRLRCRRGLRQRPPGAPALVVSQATVEMSVLMPVCRVRYRGRCRYSTASCSHVACVLKNKPI